jgi:O-antigen/teichoic acid export membrane protein
MRMVATGGRILASRLGQVAANGIIGLLLAAWLGPADLGRYSLTLAAVMLTAALLNGGLGLAAVPPLRRGEVRLARTLSAQVLWILLAAVVLGGMLALIKGPVLAGALAGSLGWRTVTIVPVGLAVLALLAFDIFFYDLLAVGRLVTGPLVNFGRAVGHLLLLGLLASLGALDLTAALTAYAITQLLAAVVIGGLLLRRAAGTAPVAVTAAAAAAGQPSLLRLALDNLRRGWHGQLSAVVSLLYLRLNLALVSGLVGSTAAGLYAFAAMLGELLWHLPGSLNPILVYTAASPTDPRGRDELTARAVRLSLAATAAAALLLGLAADPVLSLVFGGRYAGSTPVLRLLLPGIVAFAPGAVLAGDFIGRGRPVWNAQASLLTVAACGLAGWLLVPRLGAPGAALASSLAYLLGAGLMLWRFHAVSGLAWQRILLLRPGDLPSLPVGRSSAKSSSK